MKYNSKSKLINRSTNLKNDKNCRRKSRQHGYSPNPVSEIKHRINGKKKYRQLMDEPLFHWNGSLTAEKPMIFADFEDNTPLKIFEQHRSKKIYPMIVLPFNYPTNIFSQDHIDEMERILDEAPTEGLNYSRFQYTFYENGYWKVICFNLYTRYWLINRFSQFTFTLPDSTTQYPVRVIPDKHVPKYIHMSCMLKELPESHQILSGIHCHGLCSSRWIHEDTRKIGNEYKIYFAVDPLSARTMQMNDCKMKIRDKVVKVQIEKNPFPALFSALAATIST